MDNTDDTATPSTSYRTITRSLPINNRRNSVFTTNTTTDIIDIDSDADTTATPISSVTTDTNNAFVTALEQAQMMATAFAKAAETVADAVLVATELLQVADTQDITNIIAMNKTASSSTSSAISNITDALKLANSTCTALSKADMTREFAIAAILNTLSQQPTIDQSSLSPSPPLPPSLASTTTTASSINIDIDQITPQSLTVSSNSTCSSMMVTVDTPPPSAINMRLHHTCNNSIEQHPTSNQVLSTVNHGHLVNISSADNTSIVIRGPASFVASKLYDTPNPNLDIDMAVRVVFEALFELFWKSVPVEFRRQSYPTDHRLKQWILGDVERSIGPLHYVDSNMSWDQWCRRFFPRQNDVEMPTGLRACFLNTFKSQRKQFSYARLHQFDSEIRRHFHQLDIVPAMIKNKTIWSKQKMLVDKREVFKLRAIKRPRY